ncbi:MAG: LPP20 family lipoprotein, partial [Calditrichaceae bacterium]
MMKNFYSIILIIVIFTAGLVFGQKKPSWVDNRPVNPLYYIGIGSAQKDPALGDFRKIAKDEALRDLASEITVNISSEFIHTIVEQSGMVEEDVRKQVRSSTEASLEGYELVDNWEGETEYWVYYRLDKDAYKTAKEQKLNKATGLSLDLFSKGKQSEKAGDIANALIFYIQALNPIQDYLGEPLQVDFEGSRIYLMNTIYTSVQSLLSNIELTNESGKVEGKSGQSLKMPLVVAANYKVGATPVPVKNLPLHFEFIKGEGKLLSKLNT